MKRLVHLRCAAAAVALSLAGASAAQAQDTGSGSGAGSGAGPGLSYGAGSGMTFFGWAVSGSLSGEIGPDHLGAKTYSLGPGGSLQFYRPGVQRSFSAPDDSVGLQLVGDRTLSAGVVVRGRSSRGDDDDLQGIHKIDLAIEPGVYADWWPADALRVHGELRHGVVGNSAWSGDVAADLVHVDGRWRLSIGPRVHLGDSRFTRTYFGVTPADAARSPFGIDAFAADGTYVSAGGLASAEYRWSKRWSVLANVDYRRLLGDAADSPIVAKLGSPDQFSGELGLRYRFGR